MVVLGHRIKSGGEFSPPPTLVNETYTRMPDLYGGGVIMVMF